MMAKSILNKLPDIFLSILVSFSLTYGLASASLCMDYPLGKMLLAVALCSIALYLLFYNKITTKVSIILLSVFGAAAIAYGVVYVGVEAIMEFIKEYSFWIYDFVMYPLDTAPIYQQFTVVALSVVVSVFSYFFVIKKFRFLVILITGISLFGFQASYRIVSDNLPFYLFLSATLISYIKHVYIIRASKDENEYSKPATMLMWSIPVSILIIALSMSIHASDRAITWPWLDQKYVSVYNYLQSKFDYETFDYFSLSATSGFGDNSGFLGGKVKLDSKNVLSIISDQRVYLSGISRDVYTGNKWINSNEELETADAYFTGLYDDTDEMLMGMKLLTDREDYFSDYFDANQIYVTFLNLKTKSLFKPENLKEFESKSDEIIGYFSDTGDLSSETRLKKNYQYSMKSYVARRDDDFEDILRRSKKGLYAEYLLKLEFPSYYGLEPLDESAEIRHFPIEANEENQSENEINQELDNQEFDMDESSDSNPDEAYTDLTTLDSINVNVTRYDTESEESTAGSMVIINALNEKRKKDMIEKLEVLKNNSTLIYDKYLQLPETLPQRVKDLAVSLTASAGNDYDKAKAIEKYLVANYTYNLDVPNVPRDRDFVDYFLFDQKEGYCTYFATAMTVLSRCAGLPTRYVEGYMLPPEPAEDYENYYVVTNMQAHAWVEIYFEGYGWLSFEPTSPFRTIFYTTDTPEEYTYNPEYNSSYQDYMEMMMQYYGRQGGTGGVMEFNGTPTEKGPSTSDIILICIASFCGLVVLLLLVNVLRSKIRIYRLINLPVSDSILRSYDYYLKVLKLHGSGIQPSETPHQYSERIDSELFFSPVKFKVITDIFVKTRYSLNKASDKEKLLYSDFFTGFLNEIKINMGKSKYFVLKYLLGRI